jgi:hypothetical protein
MGRVIPYIEELPKVRRFRTYVGMRTVRDKLRRLLKTFEFSTFAGFLASSPRLERIQVSNKV